MKVLAVITTLACAASAMAQGLTISAPSPGQRIPLERPFIVQIIKNPHIISSIEVALTIGIIPCPSSSGCPDPSAVGTVLYKGPYNPKLHGRGGTYQNFTVTVPFNEQLIGQSQITVNRFFLIGAQNGAVLSSQGVQVRMFSL